jgi:ketosteroid isomerase-like protein
MEGNAMPHANVQVLQEVDRAQTEGNIDTFLSLFTDDVKAHVRGSSKLAGDYEGKDQFQDLFGRFMEAAGADYSFENHAYLADDEHGVTLQTSHFKREGRTLELQEAFVLHFRDGKVSEMWYLPADGAAFDAWIGR